MCRRKSHRAQRQADVLLLLSAVWQRDMEPLEMQSALAKWNRPRESKDTQDEKRDAVAVPKPAVLVTGQVA